MPRAQVPADSASRAQFAEFYEQNMARLVRFVMRHGADGHEAAEAAQATFAAAFEQWTAIEHRQAWLRTVAFRQLMKLRGVRERPCEEVPDRPGGHCPVAVVELREEEARVYEALGWLPMKQRQALAWALDGFSAVETAEHLQMTPEAVRQNLSRARGNVRRVWESARRGAQ